LEGGVSLAAFIDELRQELTYAVASGAGHALQFGLGPVAVELSVVAARAADGRVQLGVIPAGSEYRGSPPHKITLNLAPVRADGSVTLDDYGDEIQPSGRETGRPVLIARKDVPQEVIDRFAEDPKNYR
jgi:Trypsin-co-occurring domain 2